MLDSQASVSDAELFDLVRAGQSECFAELVRRYQPALLRVARSRLGRSDWAEEVVQETFLAAFRGRDSYNRRYNFRTWLWTILLNQCYGHYQRRARALPLAGGSAAELAASANRAVDQGDSPLVQLLAKERAAQLELLLAQLSDAQADALRLRFFGELKFHEIAQAMECSLNTAKNRVRSGLMRMSELLGTDSALGAPRDGFEAGA